VQLDQARRSDSSNQRSLTVSSADLAVRQAEVTLQKAHDTATERTIVAPFDGTVEGITNVVVGATPTGGTNDPINLGSLVSDDFIASFSLSASDINRVSVGQKVLVTLTSYPNMQPLEATITQKSSLPESGTVPTYAVEALLTSEKPANIELRDGMLCNIEIVQQEKTDVVRLPLSAITYVDGNPTVTVIDGLSDSDKQRAKRVGVLPSGTGAYTTHPQQIEIGLRGQYYVEVTSGLDAGVLVQGASVTNNATPGAQGSVVRTGFGGGGGRGGGARPD
jgi:multidrug efflux pump subunit AcrA (membrane-fusion protein)